MKSDPFAQPESQRQAPGAFKHADGVWDFDASPSGVGLHRFVDMLVARRKRTPLAPPSLYAARIAASPFAAAFPNAAAWLSCPAWAHAGCSSSAEEAVKRAGNGESGHWCESFWPQTRETDCRSDGHLVIRDQGKVEAYVREIISALDSLPSVADPAPKPKPRFIADETYFEPKP